MSTRLLLIIIIGVLLALSAALLAFTQRAIAPGHTPAPFNSSIDSSPDASPPQPTVKSSPSLTSSSKIISTSDIPGAASEFNFRVDIPGDWQVEAIDASEAISFFDPAAAGLNNLDKSQIFMRHFTANDFLTLSTVIIHDRQSLTINQRPAVRYAIEKRANTANFTGQPAWRSTRHIVTDIRVSPQNPSVFYVIAARPDLHPAVYQQFLDSLNPAQDSSLIEPVPGFSSRITKKPFGIYVTPQDSPVSPERFTGYHTGVDVEYEDATADVPVRAIASGTIRLARRASGYGGVVAIEHELGSSRFAAIYGHLRPANLPAVGQSVIAGDTIGVLGQGFTSETDGERQHLHFAVLNNSTIDLRGYVASQAELSNWQNPADLF